MKVVARRKRGSLQKRKIILCGVFVIVVFMVVADVRRNVFEYRYRVT